MNEEKTKLSNGENHGIPEPSAERGRPKGLTRQAVLKVRDQIYRLHLFGVPQQQISDRVGVSPSQVSRHIEAARKGKLWTGEKPVRDRCNILIQTQHDRLEEWHGEQSRIYHALDMPLEEKAVRIRMIADVMRGVGYLLKFVPDAETLAHHEQLEELERAIAEKRQAKKINPIGPGPGE